MVYYLYLRMKEPQNTHDTKNPTVRWQAPEYTYYPKSSDWYWVLGIIALALLVYAIMAGNFLFAVLILVGSFALMMYGERHPRIVTVSISGEGVRIDDRLFPYETLHSFWIFYRAGGLKELSIESEKMLMPHLKIPLGDADPTQVRSVIVEYLPEKPQEESFIETIARRIGF